MASSSEAGARAGAPGPLPFPPCHLCAGEAREVPGFQSLCRVTSDCRPWGADGRLGVCMACGTVQSAVDDAWRAETAEIYRTYAMFHHRTGSDHAVYDAQNSTMQSRSGRLLESFLAWSGAPVRGRLLDIGCGTGPFLQAMAQFRPGWDLAGAEQDEAVRERILAIPGVRLFHAGPLDALTPGFDVVSMIHVLEHVAAPSAFLRQAAGLLAPGGSLLIQVPSLADNPFDAVVADHCTHFTPDTLARIIETSGLRIRHLGSWIGKEISVVATPVEHAGHPAPSSSQGDGMALAERTVSWLAGIAADAAALSASGSFGLLGTSIASTWLDNQIGAGIAGGLGGAGVSFFADEDPVMRGLDRLGRPVLGTDQIPASATLYCPMPRPQAEVIRERLIRGGASFRIAIPPAF